MTAVATRETPSSILAIQAGQQEFSPAQVATLTQLGVKDATREDLAIFFHQATRTGLDPFAKQIYMIGRWSREGTKQTIQTGIDGYRLIARRAADRARETLEYEDTLWCGEDGQWRDVWLSSTPPAAAKTVVIRNGGRYPAIATWTEYVQTTRDGSPNTMWSKMGANQLAKCSEALALRKAFPQDLSGIYTDAEMAQADNEAPAQQPAPRQQQSSRPASRVQQAMAQESAPMEDLGEKPRRDFLAEAEQADGDVDLLKALWKAAQAAGEPQAHLDAIYAMATPATNEETETN